MKRIGESPDRDAILEVAREAICSIGSFDKGLQAHYDAKLKAAVVVPPKCYCPPGPCQAPKIMGRQMACLDPERAGLTFPNHPVTPRTDAKFDGDSPAEGDRT